MSKDKKLLFLVTEDWYFCSHRLPLAKAAKEAGYQVTVATRVNQHGEKIRNAGLELVPLEKLVRSSINPFREISAIAEIVGIYSRCRPDLVHHVALKPVLYGSIAAHITRVKSKVNAIAGLGFTFSSNKVKARLLRPALKALLRVLLRGSKNRVIVQSKDDYSTLIKNNIISESHVVRIASAGVDLNEFSQNPMPETKPIVMLASRLLWDKGIGEFVKAADTIQKQNIDADFVLVGSPEPDNPTSIPISKLEEWSEAINVSWWGHQNNMPETLSKASIVCLPTYYGEGIPKVLIEAMACGRPIITTDMPGCRELVENGSNGYLVQPRDANELANKIGDLLTNKPRCRSMGLESRKLAERDYSLLQVIEATFTVYDQLAGSN